MSTTYTSKVGLGIPATSDRNWDIPMAANFNLLDALAPLYSLLVKAHETPSASLNVTVNPGPYPTKTGTVAAYAGVSSYPLSASSTTYLWLTTSGVLTTGASYPSTYCVRLAHVVTGTSSVTTIYDDRFIPQGYGT